MSSSPPTFLADRTKLWQLARRLAVAAGGDGMARLQADPEPDDALQAGMLRVVVEEFALRPWAHVAQRLDELAVSHGGNL